MTDERELREKVARAIRGDASLPIPQWEELTYLQRRAWYADADRAIALCREHYGAGTKLANIAHGMWASAEDELEAAKAEIARLRRERDEAYTRGWNEAIEEVHNGVRELPDGALPRDLIDDIRALRKEESDD